VSAPGTRDLLWPGARWFDDWFAVEEIDPRTMAIAEPRDYQFPVSYLLMGSDRALLFDSGSGKRDMRPVVTALTNLPVTAAFSHCHFDHLGNHRQFDHLAAFDHPELRARMHGGTFRPSLVQHLKLRRPSFQIHEWWAAGQEVDLGDRAVTVIPVPGHSPESIALLDRGRGQLFLGDFLYNAELYVTDASAYLQSLAILQRLTTGGEVLLGAHGLPRVSYGQLGVLEDVLAGVRDGRLRSRFSLGGFLLGPQRWVQSGDLDVRLLYGGRLALLLPQLFGVGLIAALAAFIGVVTLPLVGLAVGVASLIAGLIWYERF
jgi:glyoxylase-like metal-dependent hydrolase (beta-lactamase superfamily II)